MEKLLWILLLNLTLFHSFRETSTLEAPTYVAGVVEYEPIIGKNHDEELELNLAEYIKIIRSDEANKTDIIVFPEGTLNKVSTMSYVPDEEVAPCDVYDDTAFLKKLSCAIRSVGKYVVINLTEKENCTEESQKAANDSRPCAKDGLTKYNTNVVFDRNGVVISRYRKWNLFGEPGINTTNFPEHGLFRTDFGVVFQHFICFDILFYTPAADISSELIKDVIFPTMWFSELPFFTAVQIQQAWAYARDVNLLAAGASNPRLGSTGTGIYAGKDGTIVATMNGNAERKIYVAEVKKKNFINQKTYTTPLTYTAAKKQDALLKELKLLKHDIKNYTTVLLTPLSSGKFSKNEKVCHNDLCCNFDINYEYKVYDPTEGKLFYHYRFAVYSGVRTYTGFSRGYYKTCAILACTDESISSCPGVFTENLQNFTENMIFYNIKINSKFRTNRHTLVMPNSLDIQIMPLNVDEFQFDVRSKRDDNTSIKAVKYELLTTKSNILTFGLYANEFEKSGGLSKNYKNVSTIIGALLCVFMGFSIFKY